jgi:Protein of unknown function (DUF551)
LLSPAVLLWWGGEVTIGTRWKGVTYKMADRDEWASIQETDPDGKPTHWMPLPAPPTANPEGKQK